jgi:hypothetical protein
LVEQRVAEALESCDYGYVLETGRVVLEGPHRALVGRRPCAPGLSRNVRRTGMLIPAIGRLWATAACTWLWNAALKNFAR